MVIKIKGLTPLSSHVCVGRKVNQHEICYSHCWSPNYFYYLYSYFIAKKFISFQVRGDKALQNICTLKLLFEISTLYHWCSKGSLKSFSLWDRWSPYHGTQQKKKGNKSKFMPFWGANTKGLKPGNLSTQVVGVGERETYDKLQKVGWGGLIKLSFPQASISIVLLLRCCRLCFH